MITLKCSEKLRKWENPPVVDCKPKPPPCQLEDNPLRYNQNTGEEYNFLNSEWNCVSDAAGKYVTCEFYCRGDSKPLLVNKCKTKDNKWVGPKKWPKEITFWPDLDVCRITVPPPTVPPEGKYSL